MSTEFVDKTFTKYLILENIEEAENSKKITFVSYLKQDYVEKSIIIKINQEAVISSFYFSSNEYGTAEWHNGKGVINPHRWENEDDLMSISTMAHRFPTLLLDGDVPVDFAREKIIPDIVNFLLDEELQEIIYSEISTQDSHKEYDWDSILRRYAEKSKEHLDNIQLIRNSKTENYSTPASIHNYKGEPFDDQKGGNTFDQDVKNRVEEKKVEENKEANHKYSKSGKNNKLEDYIKKAEKISKKIKNF